MGNRRMDLRSANDVLKRQLQNPELRVHWERTTLARAVALRLVAYRAEHGLSQSALGRIVGMAQPAIARIEAGERVPTVETLLRLSDGLGIEFLLDIRPANGTSSWVTNEAESAAVVETVTTEKGSRMLVAVN
jgi:transcriptional regulator with XRE-family HTH domain